MNKPYFETPKQVVFHDIDNPGNWLVGIAYKDEIICACCGGIYEIVEVCELSEGYVDKAIYPYENWVPLEEEIGGDLPEGLTCLVDENNEYHVVEVKVEESVDYEQYHFELEEAEEEQAVAMFANTWVDGIAMPCF